MTGKNFLRHSLRHQITLATLVIFVAGIWALSYYASRMLREDIERLLADQQFSTVSYVADEINNELNDRIHGTERIARLIDRPLLENPRALQQMLEQRPIFQDIYNTGVFAVSRDGTCIANASKVEGRIGENYSDYDAIHTALTEGKPAVGSPMVGKIQRRPVFTIAVPIRDANGKVIGALAGTTNLDKTSFLDAIGKHRYGKSGYYLIGVPKHNVWIAATEKNRVMQPMPLPGISPLADRAKQGFEGSGVAVNSRGVESLISTKRIPAADWLLFASLPTEEAFVPIRDMQRRITIAAIFLTLTVGIFSWWLIRRQLSPLQAAVEKLAAMSDKSQPLQPLPIANHDEIGQLVGGFNHLLEIIGEREVQLTAERDFFSALLRQSSDGVFLFDPDDLRILEANTSLCKMLRYERDEILPLKLTDLAEESSDDVRASVRELVKSRQPFIAERNHLRKDGTLVATEVHASVIMAGGRQLIMANFRDITERKKMSEKLLRLNRLYAVLSKTNEAIIRIQNEETLFDRLCHIAIEQGGFRMAWVGWIDEETGVVQPLVHAGHEDGYLTQITVKACKDVLGRGATGSAIMDGRGNLQRHQQRSAHGALA
jgi:PAS domain S-box-containing protein